VTDELRQQVNQAQDKLQRARAEYELRQMEREIAPVSFAWRQPRLTVLEEKQRDMRLRIHRLGRERKPGSGRPAR
jgi:hypothetical protein